MAVIIVIHRCCIYSLHPTSHSCSTFSHPYSPLQPPPLSHPPSLPSSSILILHPLPSPTLIPSSPSPLFLPISSPPSPSLNPALLSSSSFSPFYSFYTNTSLPNQTIEVGFAVGVRALRISYVGELGWELHIPTEVICINNPLHPYLACLVTPAMLMS